MIKKKQTTGRRGASRQTESSSGSPLGNEHGVLGKTLAARGDGRRAAIMRALSRCILEKGVSGTTLRDIAKAAGMSPSHLLYYYRNRDAALEDLGATLYRRILAEVTASRGDSAAERCHMLADYFFVGHVVPPSDQGILVELLAVALHNPRLRKAQEEYERIITSYLEDLFRRAPGMPGLDPQDAAIVAASVWMGLFIVSYYDDRIGLARARRLFRGALLHLAGLDKTAGQFTTSLQRLEHNQSKVQSRNSKLRAAH